MMMMMIFDKRKVHTFLLRHSVGLQCYTPLKRRYLEKYKWTLRVDISVSNTVR